MWPVLRRRLPLLALPLGLILVGLVWDWMGVVAAGILGMAGLIVGIAAELSDLEGREQRKAGVPPYRPAPGSPMDVSDIERANPGMVDSRTQDNTPAPDG